MAKNSRFLKKNRSKMLIYGYHAALAALKNPDRRVEKAIITQEFSNKIEKKLLSRIDNIQIVSKKDFNRLYQGKNDNLQGVVLEAYYSINVTLTDMLSKNFNKILIMLDQIQDPQNIGSIMRSAAIFGCNYIISSNNNSPDLNSTIIKSSSGAAEIVNYIKVQNLVRTISEIKKYGFWVVGLDQKSETLIDEFDLPKKCLFVVGSEHKGLRNLTKKNCDYLVSIKSKKNDIDIDSLNVANATTIALYEYFKKGLNFKK